MTPKEATLAAIQELASLDERVSRDVTELLRLEEEIRYVTNKRLVPPQLRNDSIMKYMESLRQPRPLFLLKWHASAARSAARKSEEMLADLRRRVAEQVAAGTLLPLAEWDGLQPMLGFRPSAVRAVDWVIRGVLP